MNIFESEMFAKLQEEGMTQTPQKEIKNNISSTKGVENGLSRKLDALRETITLDDTIINQGIDILRNLPKFESQQLPLFIIRSTQLNRLKSAYEYYQTEKKLRNNPKLVVSETEKSNQAYNITNEAEFNSIRDGITFKEIMFDKVSPSIQEPIKVYGHTIGRISDHRENLLNFSEGDAAAEYDLPTRIKSTVNSITSDLVATRKINEEELLANQPLLTLEIFEPAKLLRQRIYESYRNTIKIFKNPQHKKFPELQAYYQKLKASGTTYERSLFLFHMAGVGEDKKALPAYQDMQKILGSGLECPLYTELTKLIEESYEGVTGEEFSEFSIPDHPYAGDITKLETEIHRLKNDVIRKLQASGEKSILIENSDDRTITLENSQDNKNPKLLFNIELLKQETEKKCMKLELLKGGVTAWNFLHTPAQLPQEYYSLMSYVKSLLESIIHEAKQPELKEQQEKKGNKLHVRDEVYNYRKAMSDVASKEATEQILPEILPKNTHRYQIAELSEDDPFTSMNGETAKSLRKAIELYNSGYRAVVKLSKTSPDGNTRFRLREGDFRIILEEDPESGLLQVIDMGNRRDIYRKY